MVNVSEKCYMLNLHHVPSVLVATERGRDACASRLAGGTPAYPAYKGRFLGKPLYTISRFSHQNAQTPPSPRVGEGGWGDEGQRRTGMQNVAHLSQKLYPCEQGE
jgi:hypothetical protein